MHGSSVPADVVDALLARQDIGNSLANYVRAARGAYPSEVLAALRRMGAEFAVKRRVELHEVAAGLSVGTSRLPLPHPLDFEWRFSSAGCRFLADEINKRVSGTASVGLFGTPWFAEASARDDLLVASSTLFELRPEACAALMQHVLLVEGDVAATVGAMEPGTFDLIVADPPWYPPIVESFLRAAASLLRDGGVLLLCLPGLGTRPTIRMERAAMIAVAADHNLALDELRAGCLEYESPPFELAALHAAGLLEVGAFWRRGDLLALRRQSAKALSAPRRSFVGPALPALWREVCIGRSRVRIDLAHPDEDGPIVVEPIVPGAVLDSVSTRDARRPEANIWTTSNRAFRTSHPSQILTALHGQGGELDARATEFAAELADQETLFLDALDLG